ncbi:uncharacterized 2Fe-2S/4Fe-4S cluster protein (DUF4445 family) [Hasllibacter halocynthiae]|uniref:Uncharacterized 2Fe-2S/4Fe-4S cluster protein (DUF4445 family) n=1 Tax=Hasllibacter halocynthiae TaxID=595589 RepID=A0A2T0X8E6_9RHOB|nr:ASKHA domain-containing protein [Hasllibacter halocynthiae]PRY95218.1 uncharacterized 2Fe-2S/4Fe-4S cluster protein (DUF4445 family) [Hasllibacter halocynthiae]
MTDPLVVFTPSGKRGRVAPGTTVLDAARRLGVDLDSVCGGNGICSKCQVVPVPGPHPKHGIEMGTGALSGPNAVEERYDRVRGLRPGRRLGCQATVMADAVLDVPPESQVHRQVIRKEAGDVAIALDPATRLHLAAVREPDMEDPSGDFERLRDALRDQWGIEGIVAPLPVLAALQPALRRGGWQVTCAVHTPRRGAPILVGVFPGLREAPPLGLAVDLGSTTIAAHLCDLSTGAVLGSGGVMNPQIRFGEDLMSRVSYAMMNPGGADRMTEAVREALNALAREVCEGAGAAPEDVFEAALVCNPVMHHLLLGLDPVELGQAPFALAVQGALELETREIGLALAPAARAYLLPCIAGHVGADAAAVALAEDPGARRETTLVVDVGTNAEIILGNERMTLACSSPTGPAFEGAQISAGQRAAPGAIERVEIDPDTKEPRFRVVGDARWSDEPGFDAPVTGICGSGIIEAIAEMRMAGIVDASGLIGSAEATGSERCVPDGRTFAYVLRDGIRVTQGDVRAIQLAKSALYAGARLLMDEMGTDVVDRVVLAGAFGAHISPRHAMVLGMIPDAPLDAVRGAGNAAGTGARMALLNRGMRARVEALVSDIRKIETATEPRFQEHFVAANALPHATAPFPNLRAVVPLPEGSFNAQSGGRRRRRRA